MDSNYLKDLEPFSLDILKKNIFFKEKINKLTQYHYKNSKDYKKILKFMNYKLDIVDIKDLPFLPIRLFKEHNLKSISSNKVYKILESSGTTGNSLSQIFLDKGNSQNQVLVLSKIISSILGKKRLPMLIIDKDPKRYNRSKFNAKIAAINGFSIFGKNQTYLLNEQNEIDYDLLINFLRQYSSAPFFMFGFTSSVFESLIDKLSIKKVNQNFKNAILLHGGGWKKMENKKISNFLFKQKIFKKLGIKKIFNYYGLIEQTGSIFLECEKCGCFSTSIFSDVIIRDKNFNVVTNGKRGMIQLLSLLPTSYPGHVILTEDIGEIVDNNGCDCSKTGKSFLVHGRAEKSEIRGCSDT